MLDALVRISETASSGEGGVPPWVFGVVAFVILALALFVVTRFDPNR
jgi:hypothetical protein